MWPRVDRERRAQAFAELRRRQVHGEAHGLTPTERLARSEDLRKSFSDPVVPGHVRRSDESAELWLRILEHLRDCG